MEHYETSTRERPLGTPPVGRRVEPERPGPSRRPASNRMPPGSSLIVGAKTAAGVGIGLLAVVAGSVALGLVAETVLVPSLLLKLAGGIAGGGLGMAKGLDDLKSRG